METSVGKYEDKNKRIGAMTSVVIHTMLLILIIASILPYPDPPPGQEGILVNLGLPDIGEGDENAPPAESEEIEETSTSEEQFEEETVPPPKEPAQSEPEPVPEREVVQTEDPNEIALKKEKERKKKEREEALQKQKEDEARKRAEAEAQKKKAEEEARKKAEADALKDEIGGLFGDGSGKGNTGKPGNQGDPEGDPNSNILEGKSTGSGVVGAGLGNRGVLARPKITDRTQKTGRVVIRVCVDVNGSVISAEYTQKGSTTSNRDLTAIAIRNARKWKFSKGDVDTQCGTITYDFKVK